MPIPIASLPAFPRTGSVYKKPGNADIYDAPQEGMSTRAWLVGMIMAGRVQEWGLRGFSDDRIAESCLSLADAILKRIEEGK